MPIFPVLITVVRKTSSFTEQPARDFSAAPKIAIIRHQVQRSSGGIPFNMDGLLLVVD